MTSIFFDSNHIQAEEIEEHYPLIEHILRGELHFPQVKKLAGWKHQGYDVYRAKIDAKARLFYCVVDHAQKRTLLVLAVDEEHNYNKMRRAIDGSSSYDEFHDNEDEKEEHQEPLEHDGTALNCIPVITYNKMFLELDEIQKEGLDACAPGLLLGPPGSGKTAILYTAMLRFINSLSSREGTTPILFLSSAKNHLKTLQAAHNEEPFNHQHATVTFSTWQERIQQHYPDLREANGAFFATWIKKYLPDDALNIIRYEMSLATVQSERYTSLGERQSYYSGNHEKQQQLISALGEWQDYLKQNKLFDPMCTVLPVDGQEKCVVFCDETQNLPPVALDYLIKIADSQHFVACLDSEQCLLTSPFIHNCLKELMHHHFGTYFEHMLPRTWRCPPAVTKVASHLIRAKHSRLNNELRRDYKVIESTLDSEGLISWVTGDKLEKLRSYAASPKTVVIVGISPSSEERVMINEKLGSNNILTAEEAIGMDFETVILWKPISQTSLATLRKGAIPTLEQINTINRLFVSLTRAKESVYMYQPDQKKYLNLIIEFFGEGIPTNTIDLFVDTLTHEEHLKLWQEQIDQHLLANNTETARQLMKHYLKRTDEEITRTINELAVRPATPVPVPNEVKESHSEEQANSSALPPRETIKVKENKKLNAATLASMDEHSVNAIFANENSEETLFQKQKNGSCLLIQFLNTPALCACTIANLSEHANLQARITPEFLCTKPNSRAEMMPLYHLLTDLRGLKLLNEKLSNDEFKNKITPALIALLSKEDNHNPFTFLAQTSPGLKILYKLNGIVPISKAFSRATVSSIEEIDNATKERLAAVLKKTYQTVKNPQLQRACADGFSTANLSLTSIQEQAALLTTFTANIDRIFLLVNFLKYRPDVIEKIHPEAWSYISTQTGSQANASPFFNLTTTTEGLNVLFNLIKINTSNNKKKFANAIIDKMNAHALIATRSNEAEAYSDSSSLYWLSSSGDEGLQILEFLFAKRPALMESITAQALSLPFSFKDDTSENATPFYWLAGTDKGRIILMLLFRSNPRLKQELQGSTLFLKRTAKAKKMAGETAFFLLTNYAEGALILTDLIITQDDLAQQITTDHLYTIGSSFTSFTSSFFWLTTTQEGCEFLNILFTKNPVLIQDLSLDILCYETNKYMDLFGENRSPLALLMRNEAGQKVIFTLLEKNERLKKQLSPEGFHELSLNRDKITPYYWLSFTPRGYELKQKLTVLCEQEAQRKATLKQTKLEARVSNTSFFSNSANISESDSAPQIQDESVKEPSIN